MALGDLTHIDTTKQGINIYNDVWGDGTYIYTVSHDGIRSYSADVGGYLHWIDHDYQQEGLNAYHYNSVWGDGSYIYVATGRYRVLAFYTDGSGKLAFVTSSVISAPGGELWGDGTYIYLAGSGAWRLSYYEPDGSGGLSLISSSTSFTESIGSQETQQVWGDGEFIYVVAEQSGLRSWGFDNDDNLVYLDKDNEGDGEYYGVGGEVNGYIFVGSNNGIRSYKEESSAKLPGGGLVHQHVDNQGGDYYQVWSDGTLIYVCTDGGLRSYTADGSGRPIHLDVSDPGGTYDGIWGDGNFIYVVGDEGIHSFSVDLS